MQNEGKFQPEEQLDEAGLVPAQEEAEELKEAKLSGEIDEKKLGNMVVEFESAVEW
jgi:hypothetical protein